MAENNTSVEYNLDKNSDCEGYTNGDTGDNESVEPDSDPDLLDIEVSSMGSSKVSHDHTDFGDKWYDNGPNTVMMLLLLPMQTFLTGQLTLLT